MENSLSTLRIPVSNAIGNCAFRTLMVKDQPKVNDPADAKYADRSIFITPLDSWITKDMLWKCFEAFGKLHEVCLKKGELKGRLQCSALIRFKHKESHSQLMKYAGSNRLCPTTLPFSSNGITKFKDSGSIKYPDPDQLSVKVQNFIFKFEEKERTTHKAREGVEVDEDGFTKVRSTGATKAPDGTRMTSFRPKKINEWETPDDDIKKKKKRGEYDDFYNFQTKEKKRKLAVEEKRNEEKIDDEMEEFRRKYPN